MSNMSYCRFQNTSGDLHECKGVLEELLGGACSEPLSLDEVAAAKRLVMDCLDLVLNVAEAAGLGLADLDNLYADDKVCSTIAQANKEAAEAKAEDEKEGK